MAPDDALVKDDIDTDSGGGAADLYSEDTSGMSEGCTSPLHASTSNGQSIVVQFREYQEEIRSTHPVAVHLKGDRSEDHPDVVDRRDVSVAEQVVQVDAAGAGDAPSEDQRAPTAPSERPRNEDVTLVTDLHVMDLHVDDPTIPRIEATLTSSSFTPIPITSYLSASAFCVIVLASGALIALVVTGAHVWITEVADVDV
eukprot:TRINITY_DN29252_c0_g1_i2.p1 TRINITY_DN29252_c0_g1~~TRINITY_DN29252_c0_g1_i2.p1  ORF type:complete len:207 (-),score=37.10 TRINITY_DN29252_c0_g1_i2:200-796(-)